jgi:cobalt/nickel transport system permease protein
MHIPDGYLSPQTAGILYAAMIPVWFIASKITKKTLKTRQVPYLAMASAFTFVVMMFNLPVPGGSTGHATGAALVAILLGPWQAVIAITVSLVIQALLFGDGGITALGANCFNMAFILPFAGYYTYKLMSLRAPQGARRRIIAAGIAGYVGLNAAALAAGIEFGLQPLLHHAADGQALYCPYGLNVAVPAMMLEHLLIFGWLEAIVTALVVAYLKKQNISFFIG